MTTSVVLVVEDEPAIAELLRSYLARDGFEVQVAADGESGLPGLDGTEVCRRLRADGDWTPVLFVTARDDEVDRVLGLELGADDYLTKPFSPRELVARVKTVLRRSRQEVAAPEILRLGAVRVDPGARRAYVGEAEV